MEFSITNETCRVCLENTPESKLLSDPYPAETQAASVKLKLQCYLDVYKYVAERHDEPATELITPPSMSPFFPLRICDGCIAQLRVALVFRRKILKSENVLKNLLDLYGHEDLKEVLEVEEIENQHNMSNSNDEVQKNECVDEEIDGYFNKSEYSKAATSFAMDSNVENNLNQQLTLWNKGSNIKPNVQQVRSKSPLFKGRPVMSQCEDCGKMIQTRFLKKHRASHLERGKSVKRFACDLCDRQYTLKANLNKHKRIHSNDRRYTCPYCKEKFLHRGTCKYHILSRHTGEKPYVCEICCKSFRHISQKYLHVRQHTGLTPYACELCDRQFVSLQNMKRHQLSHTDAKNFHCNICGKSYKSKKSLSVHTRTLHDQERNYICSVCNRAFFQNHILRTHLLKDHPEYDLPTPGTIVNVRAIKRMKEHSAATVPISTNGSSETRSEVLVKDFEDQKI